MTVIKQGEKIARREGLGYDAARARQAARGVKGPAARPARDKPARPAPDRSGVALSRPLLTATSRARRIAVVLGLLGAAAIAAVMAPPIPQDPAYHRLADARAFCGIPNALNVTVQCAVRARRRPRRVGGPARRRESGPPHRRARAMAVDGLLHGSSADGLGSAYYHLDAEQRASRVGSAAPGGGADGSLRRGHRGADRVRAGTALLAPLVAAGLGSVLWWHAGEVRDTATCGPTRWCSSIPSWRCRSWCICSARRYTRGGAVPGDGERCTVRPRCSSCSTRRFSRWARWSAVTRSSTWPRGPRDT